MGAHPTTSVRYEIRIRGVLSESLLTAFPGLHGEAVDGETLLTGELPDQAALHGVLAQIEALGLELLELRRDRVSTVADQPKRVTTAHHARR